MHILDINPLVVLILGIVAATAPLATGAIDAPRRRLLYGAVFAQVLTQGVQYANVPGRAERERNISLALYAYSQYINPAMSSGANNFCLLQNYAEKNSLIDPDYFLGYAAFRNKQYDRAAGYFSSAIHRGSFLAPSNYLLGTIERIAEKTKAEAEHRLPNYRPAADLMTKSIQEDSNYEGAYYGRAIIYELNQDHENALKDLTKAVKGAAPCLDINDKAEQDDIWKTLRSSIEFQNLLRCKQEYKVCN